MKVKLKNKSNINKNINRTIQLTIQKFSNEFYFRISVVDINNSKTNIILQENDSEDYSLRFTHQNNDIHFINDLINNPFDYKLYTINYEEKEYQVIAEVLLSSLFDDFIKKIKKEFIINKLIIKLPNEENQKENETKNKMVKERIKVSLDAIGLTEIEISEEISFDYEEQGNILNELLEKKETNENKQKMISKAKEFQLEEKMEAIDINKNDIETELQQKFTLQQRREMKLYNLDNYCIFIASRYFESLDDHINLMKVSRRMRGNMEKFHYNPISISKQIANFFPNVETQHIYQEEKYLTKGRIAFYVDWNRFTYSETQQIKQMNEGKNIEFKNVIWTQKDMENIYKKNDIPETKDGMLLLNYFKEITIPESVTKINENSFIGYNFDKLILPSTLKILPQNVFEKCKKLTNISITLNKNQDIFGNRIFNIHHLKEDIVFPSSIKIINGKEVKQLTSFRIPTTVTSIDKDCFLDNDKLKQLIIPDSVISIPQHCLTYLTELTNLSISLNERRIILGNKIFKNQPHLQQFVYLPSSVQIINGKEIQQTIAFKIPTTITSLDENCFERFNSIQHLFIPTSIKMIPQKCLEKLNNLITLTIPTYFTSSKEKIFFEQNNSLYSVNLPKSIKGINKQIVTPLKIFTIPTNITKLSDYCFANLKYLTEINGLENVKEFGNGCFFNCPLLKKEQNSIIRNNDKKYLNQLLSDEHIKQFEEWIEMECFEILFDSNFDDWSVNKCVFNDKIKERKHLLFLIEDQEGEKFGYYLESEINKELINGNCSDYKSFAFNIESKGRLKSMMKFPIVKSHVSLCKISDYKLIELGNIHLLKQNMKSYIHHEYDDFIEFYGIEQPLRNEEENEYFIPKRISIIQMKMTEKQKEIQQKKEKEQIKQLEEWTGLKYDEKLFDSAIDNWSQGKSIFNEKIIGKKQLVFLIEDERGDIFGYYLNSTIDKNYNSQQMFSTDKFSFEFNLKSFGRLNGMMKFTIKDKSYGYKLFDKTKDKLIQLGDIILYKSNRKQFSYCEQNKDKFDYKDILNALTGRTRYKDEATMKQFIFVPKKIIVFQMNLSNEQKQLQKEKEDHLNKQREINFEKMKQKNIKEFKQLEQWIGLQCYELLFDSNIDDWSIDKSTFDDKIIGKNQLVFFIENERNEKFGCYLNCEIKDEFNKWISTNDKSFQFNLQSNGRLSNMMKFESKNNSIEYFLCDKSDKSLIKLGDIFLNKENDKSLCYCLQNENKFVYHGIKNALCGKTIFMDKQYQLQGEYFVMKRICIIQMK